MDKLVYLTYPAMIAILLIGAKWNRKDNWNDEFMSLSQTKYIQGYLAIVIMLHHIGQETCASWQKYPLIPGLEFFVPIGYLCVAMFFMCSGFGLFKSYKAKTDYFTGFFRKRVLPLVLAFFFSNWIYFIARIIMKEKMNGWKVFCYISGWGLPNLYGWFVLVMPLFYLIFYLSFRLFKSENMKIWGVVIGTFIYTFAGTWIDHNDYWMRGEWWYNCVHLFWIGILFARYEKQVTDHVKRHYRLYLVLSLVGTLMFFYTSELFCGIFSYYGEYNRSLSHVAVVANRWKCLSMQMLSCLFFVAAVLIINMKLKIGNKLLGFMGGITLEFYLLHGLFLEFFSYKFCEIVPSITRIKNVALLIIIVFVMAVPASLIFRKMIHIGQKKTKI